MDNKPFSRNEIASRSRKRHQIKKEEAQKLGVVQKPIWLSESNIDAVKIAGFELDEAIHKGLSLLLGDSETELPMKEIDENAFIRAKQVGL